MSRTTDDPAMRLRIALRALAPDDRPDPDAFAELAAAFCAMGPPVTVEGAPKQALARHFGFEERVVAEWAAGASTPTPMIRHAAARRIRAMSVELGVKED